MYKRSTIRFLIFVAIILGMCQCTASTPAFPYFRPNDAECSDSYRICLYTCPGKDPVTLPPEEWEWSREQLMEKYCVAPTPTPTSTALPATATSTAEPQKQRPGPMLTGKVTWCDLKNNLINLRIEDGYRTTQFSSLKTSIGGQEVTCGVNPSNTSLYTCALPTPLLLPAQVIVVADGFTLNDFSIDGSSCIIPQDIPEDDEPPATPWVDCQANPSGPEC